MFDRIQFFVPSLVLDKIVREFTLSARFWTAYPADKIETILRYNHIIPDLMYYSHYDQEQECAVFSINKYDMPIPVDLATYKIFGVAKQQKLLKPSQSQPQLPEGASELSSNDPFLKS